MIGYGKYFAEVNFYRNRGKPLPEQVQAYKDNLGKIGALDLSDGEIREIFPRTIWKTALFYNINLFPADLEYTINVIKKDRKFNRVDYEDTSKLSKSEEYDFKIKELSCLERFYNDKDCPPQLKKVFDAFIMRDKGEKILKGLLLSLHDFVVDVLRRNRSTEQSNEYETSPKKPKNDFANLVLIDKLKKQSQI